MKVLLVLALAAVALVVISAKACKESDACADGECCVGFTPFRGTCRKLTVEGRKCLVNEKLFPFNEIYIVSCPCADGLECVANADEKNDGKCQTPTTEAPATEAQTTPGDSGETTGDSGDLTTAEASNEVTDDANNEVTDDANNEVTGDASNEVTDGANNEVTEGGSSQEVEKPAEVDARRR